MYAFFPEVRACSFCLILVISSLKLISFANSSKNISRALSFVLFVKGLSFYDFFVVKRHKFDSYVYICQVKTRKHT